MHSSIKHRARTAVGAVRRYAIRRLRTGGLVSRRLYFAVFNNGFRREQAVVSAGQRAYYRSLADDKQRFLVRRNTHMLEKSLIMRPRRGTFAAQYIEETVRAFFGSTKASPPVLSAEETEWTRTVLDEYFEATAGSEAPQVVGARALYAEAREPGLAGSSSGRFGPQPAPTGEPPLDVTALLRLAERRKSVRWFTPEPVDRDVIDTAMQIGAESPSACNRQPFKFRIFDEPELVAEIATVPLGTTGYAHNIPYIAVIVGDMSAFYDERDRHLIYIDGCLAAMGFILGLEAQGIGSCCINWPDIAAREKRMRTLLRLEDHERPVMLIAFGHADPTGRVPFSARRSLDALRSYNER